MTADYAGQTGGERESDRALQNLRDLLDGTDNQTLRIVTMLKDLLPAVHRGGQVEHVRRFVTHEIALASRPVPVPGQAAREAAVEAVARELGRHQGLRGPMDDDRPDVWQNRCECGWDDGDEHPGWRERYRLHVAVATLSLPAVVALSATPGQET